MEIADLKNGLFPKYLVQKHEGSKKASCYVELVWKKMSSSYHMKQKIFTKASCTNDINTGETAVNFEGLLVGLFCAIAKDFVV